MTERLDEQMERQMNGRQGRRKDRREIGEKKERMNGDKDSQKDHSHSTPSLHTLPPLAGHCLWWSERSG